MVKMGTSRTRRSIRFGWTLVEVIVVTIILVIAASIVIPMVTETEDMQARSAARMIASDVQFAQNTAITTQTNANGAVAGIKVIFIPNTGTTVGSYKLLYDDNKSSTVKNPMTGSDYNVVFTGSTGFGSLKVVSTTFAQNTVEFDATGSPSNAGSVTVQAGTTVYTIAVAASTGKVTVTCVHQ
jgi:Tfp pilus assembly protein FimT